MKDLNPILVPLFHLIANRLIVGLGCVAVEEKGEGKRKVGKRRVLLKSI
jgi:hypothetical protein